jgi:hypothetical protein
VDRIHLLVWPFFGPYHLHYTKQPMATTACLLAWAAALLLLPVLVLLWATESRHTRIQRWRRNGQTWAVIADRLGCAPSTAKRWSLI